MISLNFSGKDKKRRKNSYSPGCPQRNGFEHPFGVLKAQKHLLAGENNKKIIKKKKNQTELVCCISSKCFN